MRRRIKALSCIILLMGFILTSCKTSSPKTEETYFQYGLETGELHYMVKISYKNGWITEQTMEEIQQLQEEYYKNPIITNAVAWHDAMRNAINEIDPSVFISE